MLQICRYTGQRDHPVPRRWMPVHPVVLADRRRRLGHDKLELVVEDEVLRDRGTGGMSGRGGEGSTAGPWTARDPAAKDPFCGLAG